MEKRTIVIIGAGASGMACAIEIKKQLRDTGEVILLDRLDRVGKKILATGNGRCNFTNLQMSINYYNHPTFVKNILDNCSPDQLRDWFFNLGLISKADSEGRVYPYSENASSVLDVLRQSIKTLGITCKVNFDVKRLSDKDGKILIEATNNYFLLADMVVISTGGASQAILGSNGSGYKLLKSWKINIIDPIPGLVGLKTKPVDIKGLSGIRSKTMLTILDKKTKEEVFKEKGEIIFKDDGINGIVVMNATSFLNRNKGNYIVSLDLLDQISSAELLHYLENKCHNFPNLEVNQILVGLCHNALANRLIFRANINQSMSIGDLTKKDLSSLIKQIKEYTLDITGTYDFDRSQVTIGGISLDEINPNTLSLYKNSKIFITGEVMDIDGMCGGYNLHYAFASGIYVGKTIIKELQGEINE